MSLRPAPHGPGTASAVRRPRRVLLAAAALVAALVASAVPGVVVPAQAAISPYMSYDGTTVNNARIPAEGVEIVTTTSVAFDRGTYWIGSAPVGAISSVTASGTVSGTVYAGSGIVDLSGRSGSVTLTAKLYKGKYMVQSVFKVLRLVPPNPLGIPAGFPNADTTGVPDGTVLTATGDVVVTTAGAVLENLDMGCLTVRAANVVVRGSRITCAQPRLLAVALQDAPGFVMEDSEIDGAAGAAEVAIGWSGYTLRRVEVRGTQDGPRLGNDVTIEDSWVHALVRDPAVHTDAVQSTSGVGILVRHNTLDPRTPGTDDFLNAAVQLGTETGQQQLRDAVFEGNFINGGAYTVNVSCVANVDASVVFSGNRFGHGSRYGAVIAPAGPTFTDNVWADTGTAVPIAPAC